MTRRIVTKGGVAGATLPTVHYEVHEEDRGAWGGAVWLEGQSVDTLPACFVRAFNITDEVVQLGSPITQSVKTVIDKDRACRKWYPWTPGFSPQQHLEEMKMLDLEQRRREFEEKMEASRRRFDWFLAAVVVVLALAEVFATLLGLPGDHWLFQWIRRVFESVSGR